MNTWREELTAAVVVTERPEALVTDALDAVQHFRVPTRKGHWRHFVLTATDMGEAGDILLGDALGPSLLGRYRRMAHQLPAQEPPPSSRGLLVGLTDPRSPEEYEGFNRWYDTVHAADVLKSGLYWRAHRYELMVGDAPTFLACYESSRPGVAALDALMAHYKNQPSPVDPICLVRHVWPFERDGQH